MSKKTKASGGGAVDNSPKVHQKKKIDVELHIKEFKWTARQQAIIDAALSRDTRLTFIDGIWGSGKTLISLYICLHLLKQKKISNILYIRNAVQSGSGTLGWLPGSLEERFGPYATPLLQKLEELLPKSEAEFLVKNGIVETMPACLIRGTSYNAYGMIIDEIGCMTKEDIMLVLSRAGEFTHVFGVGDSHQVDVRDSGFRHIFNIFDDEESRENGVFAFELQEEMDIMRSKLLKFVMGKIRHADKQKELDGVWQPKR
jgi:phosphate starvation-inducible PhoH-like protein